MKGVKVIERKSCQYAWIEGGKVPRICIGPRQHRTVLTEMDIAHFKQRLFALITTKYKKFNPKTIKVTKTATGHVFVSAGR